MKTADQLNHQVPLLDDAELERFVQSFLDRRELFLGAVSQEGSPLYLIDTDALKKRAGQFRQAFDSVRSEVRVYYAVKSNNHPVISNTLVAEGFGLDVSSGLELQQALQTGAKDIVFSGPGKLPDELTLAVEHPDRVTVLVDSFAELDKLESITKKLSTSIKIGIRITTDDNGLWKKFGIPLSQLSHFMDRASQCDLIDFRGIQFHISWSLNAEAQVIFITRLCSELRSLNPSYRARIRFIDVGGGFWPEQGEWLQAAATPNGLYRSALGDDSIKGLEHFKRPACTIRDFATHISAVLRNQLPEEMNPAICLEPGRWLSNESMHVLLTVADKKSHDVVITDGGINAIGWERFESDYFPVINLSRPALEEHECLVAGSLCTPHDLWGYSYFGEDIKEGDVLLIPNQGAYTYSLRQNFIKPIPKCVTLPHDRSALDVAPANEKGIEAGENRHVAID